MPATAPAGSSEERGLTDPTALHQPAEGSPTPPTGDGSAEVGLDVDALGQRAVGQLVVRAILVRGITLVGTIALARLLTPAEFGAFAVVSVIVSFITIAGDFGTSAALIQQRHDPTDLELSTAFVTQLGIWSVVAAIIFLVAGAIPSLQPDLPSDVPVVARLLAISLFTWGLRAIPTVMLSRVLRFGPLALVEIGQQIVYFGAAVALAATGHGIVSFALAAVAQSVFATVVIDLAWGRWLGLRFDAAIARRLWTFGLGYQVGQALAWGRDAVVPALGGLAGGLQAIGFLGFAWRNGQLVTAVEQIVQRVAFPAFSRIQHEPERQAAMTRSSIELVTLAVATIQGWIVATAPILVPIVFSDRWTPAVVPLQIVCLGSLASAPTYVLRALVYARGNSQLGLKLSGAGLVVLIVSFLALATTYGLVGAAISFAFSAYAGLGLYVWATRATVAFPWAAVARIVVVVGAAAIAGGLVALAWPTLPGLVLSGLVYLGTIAGLGFILDRPLAVQLLGLVPIRR